MGKSKLDEKGERQMADLTPNENVGTMEKMGANAVDVLYATMLRGLVIEKVDDVGHLWDDSVVAMFDGAFAYKQ